MTTRCRAIMLGLCLGLGLAVPAGAHADPQAAINEELRAVPKIYNGLFAVAVANEVRRECETIGPRVISAWRFVRGLQAHARELGYTDEQTEAFVTDKDEQDRMQVHVDRYLAENGVNGDDPESYCALGRAEIAAGSQAGQLLYIR